MLLFVSQRHINNYIIFSIQIILTILLSLSSFLITPSLNFFFFCFFIIWYYYFQGCSIIFRFFYYSSLNVTSYDIKLRPCMKTKERVNNKNHSLFFFSFGNTTSTLYRQLTKRHFKGFIDVKYIYILFWDGIPAPVSLSFSFLFFWLYNIFIFMKP